MGKFLTLSVFTLAFFSAMDSTKAFGIRDIIQNGWRKFWSVSCEHSTIIARSKRSIDVPIIENNNNIDEMFDYLYPSAHITVEDLKVKVKNQNFYNEGGDMGRSSGGSADFINSTSENQFYTPRTFFSWVDTVIDLWQTECRRQMKMGEESTEQNRDMKHPENESTSTNTSIPILPQNKHDNDTLQNITYANSTEALALKNKAAKQVVGGGIPGVSNLALKQQDTFFSAFGGDIEYFIPLVSFGLPFDGEITLLGFHGFKGLFPYK